VTLGYIKATPEETVVVDHKRTRTLELDATQVEGIVRLWALEHAGFTDPHIETACSWDGMFSGMTLTETTSTRVADGSLWVYAEVPEPEPKDTDQ
jgi:hypothetical protein